MPSESAIAAILQRAGLTALRRRRRQRLVVPAARPFAAATAPNAVWCVDFKGWWRTRDGRRCYPLTLIDAYSRYLLRCEALLDPDTQHVQPIVDSAFQEFGRPHSTPAEARYHGRMPPTARVVYVVDAWDDDDQVSYVRVFADADAAREDLARWKARRARHDVYAGVLERRVQ